MSAMIPGGPPVDDDDHDQLAGETVSYWDCGTFVVQDGHGKLLVATDTVARVER